MTATLIDGKAFAANVRENVAKHVALIKQSQGITPGLAVVLVGNDSASHVYVRSKEKLTLEVGMHSFVHRLSADTSEDDVMALIHALNQDDSVHGILVQLPLPKHIDETAVINAIEPAKDVDGFHIFNAGRLATGQQSMVPCTPLGCLMMLREYYGDLSGLNAVVIGRSNIVGKPMSQLLLKENCTVTMVHSRTRNLPNFLANADIVVAAIGQPLFVKSEWLKSGATIIDVGINRIEQSDGTYSLVGDVDFEQAKEKVGAITPVPGGVGPMTIACLLANTVTACCRAHNLPEP